MKRLGIGYENYKRILDDGCYYMDKTLLIRDIVQKGGMVTLFTRPRRFGKTLALSMIRTFFELEYDRDGNVVDNSRYFDGMKIMGAGDDILSLMGQYPVINLSLKSAKQPRFFDAFWKLREEIIREIGRHEYLAVSDRLQASQKSAFQGLLDVIIKRNNLVELLDEETEEGLLKKEMPLFSTAIRILSECLRQHHGRNVIILIDEYDMPLENAYFAGFYDEMVGFIRSLFESALKTNDALERAVITGCLRISKESIFAGLNNLEICSIRSTNFGEYFGFTQDETEEMLAHYDLADKVEEVREWYDGYLFGEAEVYNPWSVIKYVSEHVASHDRFPEPYWANTSSNAIIKDLVYQADEDRKKELDGLIAGRTIEKRIHEDITYDDVYVDEDNLWNFLFFTGYMKKVSERKQEEDIYVTMEIPNAEVRSIYRNQIVSWFEGIKKEADRSVLFRAIVGRDGDAIGDFMSELLEKTISTFDSGESFYHGFFISLLSGMPRYAVRSNREEGIGRPDAVLYPNRPKDPAY
ncbi:MAG: AAA family ATPase, partial [Lachnospiraceae bacterium]|nr:AAA family ATPase [Lachnospiraceae bacterium]